MSSSQPSITLYFAPFTRATRPRWLLEELGVPYELHLVDMKAGAHKAKDYIDYVHPHGVVPALKIDGEVLIESGAIVAYLADRFLDKGLAPGLDDKDRGKYLQWLFYSYATLEPAVSTVASATPSYPFYTGPLSPEAAERAHGRLNTCLDVLQGVLDGREWLLSRFSAADVVVASILLWADHLQLLGERPALRAYVERSKARPAYQAARQ